MIAVADASPVCYLILIGEIELLPALFAQVLLPKTVLAELLDPGAPPQVREWAAALPGWVSVQEVPATGSAGLEYLHAGERAAILLAESAGVDLILLDEKSARRAGLARGLKVSGLLGILAEAANRGLVDLPLTIDRLRTTNFRCSPALLKATLDRFKLADPS